MAKKIKKKQIDTFLKVLELLQYPESYEKVRRRTGCDFEVTVFPCDTDECYVIPDDRECDCCIDSEEESDVQSVKLPNFFEVDDCSDDSDDECNDHENDGIDFEEKERSSHDSYEDSEIFRNTVIIPKIEKYLTQFINGSLMFDIDASFLAKCNDARIRGFFEPNSFGVYVVKRPDFWYFIPLDNACNNEGGLVMGYKMPTVYFTDGNDIDKMIIEVASRLHLDVCIVPDQNLMIFSYDLDA